MTQMYSTEAPMVSCTTRVITFAIACFPPLRPSRMSHSMTGTVLLSLFYAAVRSLEEEHFPAQNAVPYRDNFANIAEASRIRVVRRTRVADRNDGQDSGLLQAPGFRVPEFGDLRRHPLLLRLRSSGRRDEAEHQRGVVAPHGAHARRRGGAGRRNHHAPQSLGGFRAPLGLQRHARRE